MPRLSVVVPFYNVERFIGACLDSLRRQTLGDLEVVLVDDGSLDGSGAIAAGLAASDPRFRVVVQENRGLGPARNTGVRHARGEYLAFADSDDLLHPRAYERAVRSLEATGSDFATARAARFDHLGVQPSYLHELAITEPAVGARIAERPELVLDRMIWNKVFRRTFWDSLDIEFAAMVMEDFPVSARAHVAAAGVDVIDEVAYYWRSRDGGEPSITQRSAELPHLRDRVATGEMVIAVISAGAPDALPVLRRHLLEVDVHTIIAGMLLHPPAERAPYLELGQRLLGQLGPDPSRSSPAFYKVEAALVAAGDIEGLAALHAHARRFGKAAEVVRRGRLAPRYVEKLPGLGTGAVPAAAYEVKRGRPPVQVRLDDAAWDETGLAVTLLVATPYRLGRGARVEVWCEREDGTRISGRAGLYPRARPPVGEDLVEIRTWIDAGDFRADDPAARGFHALRVRLRAAGLDVTLPVEGHGRARHLPPRDLPGPPGLVLQPYTRGEDGFGVTVQRPLAVVTSCSAADGLIALGGFLRLGRAELPGSASLVVSDRHGGSWAGPITLERDGKRPARWSASVPAAEFADDPAHRSVVAVQTPFTVRLEASGHSRVLSVAEGFTPATVVVGHRMLAATRNGAGNLELVDNRISPEVTAINWTGPSTLRFEGCWRGADQLPASVVLQHFQHPTDRLERRTALQVEGDRYRFDVEVAALVEAQLTERDRFDGPDPDPWHLVFEFGDHRATQVHDRTAAISFAPPRIIGGRRVEVLLTRNDVVRIGISG